MGGMSDAPILGPEETGIILAGALYSHFGCIPEQVPAPGDSFWDWFQSRLPHTAEAMRLSVIHQEVQRLLDRKVLDGELIAERIAGTTSYRKVVE